MLLLSRLAAIALRGSEPERERSRAWLMALQRDNVANRTLGIAS